MRSGQVACIQSRVRPQPVRAAKLAENTASFLWSAFGWVVTSAARSVKKRPQFTVFARSLNLILTISLSVAAIAAAAAEAIAPAAAAVSRSRVSIVQEPGAVEAYSAVPEKVRRLVTRGILQFTGLTNENAAWRSLVSTQDVIGIKVHSIPGALSGTRPSVVSAVIESLLNAGIAATNIVIWDRQLTDLRLAGYGEVATRFNVRLASSTAEGFDAATFYDSPITGNLVWGDLEFEKKGEGVGRKSFVSKLVSKQITRIIDITPLLNHNQAGVTGHIVTLPLASVDNALRFESQPDRLATALPELYALPAVGDKVVLNITDALIAQYQGEQRSLLHYSSALNQLWFSKDPVALDVLAIQELDRQRRSTDADAAKPNMAIYSNASLLELGQSDVKNIQVDSKP